MVFLVVFLVAFLVFRFEAVPTATSVRPIFPNSRPIVLNPAGVRLRRRDPAASVAFTFFRERTIALAGAGVRVAPSPRG